MLEMQLNLNILPSIFDLQEGTASDICKLSNIIFGYCPLYVKLYNFASDPEREREREREGGGGAGTRSSWNITRKYDMPDSTLVDLTSIVLPQ